MSRAKVNYKNPDFKEETDEFSDIVDDFITQRKILKKNLKEQRGEIVTERVGQRPLTRNEMKQKPTIEALDRLTQEVKRGRNVFLTMFQMVKFSSQSFKIKRIFIVFACLNAI